MGLWVHKFGVHIVFFTALSLMAVSQSLLFSSPINFTAEKHEIVQSVSAYWAQPKTIRYERSTLVREVALSSSALLHFNGGEILKILNRPEKIRQDLPTVVWQYANDICVLDVFFVTTGQSVLQSAVMHYEIRGRDAAASADAVLEKDCMGSLLRERSGEIFL